MHEDRTRVEARLDRFVRDRLLPAVHRDAVPLHAAAWSAPGEPVPFAEAVRQHFEPVPAGWRWGRAWSTTWFRLHGALPPQWRGGPPRGTRLEVLVDFGYNGSRAGFQAEGMAYRPDGSVVKAVHPFNSYVPWDAADGDVDLFVEAAANPDVAGEYSFAPTPYGSWETAPEEPLYSLSRLELALLDEVVWELAQDVWTLRGLMHELPDGGSRRHAVLRALESMLDVVDPHDVAGTAAQGRATLADVLASPAAATSHRVLATGHAHIDSAWLWPLRETVRKCARTFTNVLALMDEHPDLVFACSSAQQYQWMKDHHPDVFARIREKAAAGRFVPVGGMWVESDTNMPGSEAMARQLVLGKRFFLEELGVDCEEAWLPDSFGYSAALPQIVRAAGLRWFLTQKISWNQVNRMPHHTFWWEGIDGSRVFTHFPPVDTYISELSGAELAHAERTFREKGRATWSLVPFGWGDGGGGPTREMVAAARRTADLEGSPRVTLGSPREFFEAAEAEYPDPPVWSGEMYLELHRGVFTSQLRTKQGNRRNESLLRQAELWAATAALRVGHPYPRAELEEAWRTVLLLQFHDILPGSSIAWVHREAERRHAGVTAVLERLVDEALAALAAGGAPTRGLVANASPFDRAGVPALGLGRRAPEGAAVDVRVVEGGHVLDNGVVRVVVDGLGRITSLRSRSDDREAVPPSDPAVALRLHRDTPTLWDAWDLDEHYRRTVTELQDVTAHRIERGDGGAVAVVAVHRVGASVVELRVGLRPGADAVEVDLHLDWHEREKILKLAVPLDVHADRLAVETQFGHVHRPTHTNTSWDAARFEACQHRFVHVGEPGYGVAVVNDSTYGYDVERRTRADGGTTTTVRFSVVRAPLFPDPDSDQGEHRLRFRLRPASDIGDAVEAAYDLHAALRPVPVVVGATDGSLDDSAGSEQPAVEPVVEPAVEPAVMRPLLRSTHPAVVVETVKLAEDGSGDLVARLYESRGGRAVTELVLDGDARSVTLTDLLERALPDEPALTIEPAPPSVPAPPSEPALPDEPSGSVVRLGFRPFQLRTVRLAGVVAR